MIARPVASCDVTERRALEPLFTLTGGEHRHPQVDHWLNQRPAQLRQIARKWFAVIRACGSDVTELIHDGCPTACVDEAAFAYVNTFTAHANVGFFQGAFLPDPAGLLEGSGKRMRHVKVRPAESLDEAALETLIANAYEDIKARLQALH